MIPSLQSGGMERVMTELIHYFNKKKDLELHLILYGKERDIFYTLPSSINLHKPDFVFNQSKWMYSTLKTLFFLRKRVREIDPEVVLSLGEYWNNFVLIALYGLKFPVYISDRCQPDKYLGILHELLRKWLYPKATGIIAQTEIAKKIYFKKSLNNNIKVIGNPIRKLNYNDDILERKNIIITVGRLIKTKHHDRLIRIFKKLDRYDWKLVIIGGDALQQNGMRRLKKLIKDLDMGDRVELTGTVSEIDSFYHKSKIFAFASSSEGFPNVIGEAMKAGLPIIAYDCIAGPSEMIDDGENGFLIPLFNDELYFKKLKRLIIDEDLRLEMGKASRKKVEKFSAEKTAEQYYSFILDLK